MALLYTLLRGLSSERAQFLTECGFTTRESVL